MNFPNLKKINDWPIGTGVKNCPRHDLPLSSVDGREFCRECAITLLPGMPEKRKWRNIVTDFFDMVAFVGLTGSLFYLIFRG